MAGILANSATKTMVAADTSASKTVSGYVTWEQIALSVTPTQADYTWSLSKPSGATSRSDLDDGTSATPRFTPDAAGNWVASVTLTDGTVYTITIGAVASTATTYTGAIKLLPQSDASVPTPSQGVTLYCGSDHSNALCTKNSAGTVSTVDVTAV